MSEISIQPLENGKAEVRGFILFHEGEYILYPEPKLDSCCSKGDLRRGCQIEGQLPENCVGKCLTLKGHFDTPRRFIVDESPESPVVFWPFLFLLVVVWQGYRFAQKKRSNALKSLRVR